MVESRKVKLLKKILDNEGLPSLSPLTVQLVELATDDGSSAKDLALIIEKDPSLTTRLLRLVGSSFFAQSGPVASIAQAVVLLGFKRIRVMALSLSLRDTFPMGKTGDMDYDYFWKASLYRAMIAQDFARGSSLTGVHPDEAFVAGLILEIGFLMLHGACSQDLREDFPSGNQPLERLITWEDKNLGVNHREVGSLVLRRWRFSENLVESQKYFGPAALDSNKPALCKIVELARMATEITFIQTENLYRVQQLAQSVLDLDPETLNGILSETFNKVENLAEQLRVKIDSQGDIITVMAKANKALVRINASMETSLQELLGCVSQYDSSLTRISEEMAQSKKEVLQNTLDAVAHEIRNPLLAIGGFASRLAAQAGGEDRGGQYAKVIAEESSRLERILNEITEYCQVFEPYFIEENLVVIIDRVIDEFRHILNERNIQVARHFPPDDVRIPLDRDGITRVLRQFFRNAISTINGASGNITVSLKPVRETNQFAIAITDDGSPVAAHIRDVLLDSNLSAKTFGEGLGLPLTRKIIEAHNGRIELKSREGGGNILNIYLPLSQTG